MDFRKGLFLFQPLKPPPPMTSRECFYQISSQDMDFQTKLSLTETLVSMPNQLRHYSKNLAPPKPSPQPSILRQMALQNVSTKKLQLTYPSTPLETPMNGQNTSLS